MLEDGKPCQTTTLPPVRLVKPSLGKKVGLDLLQAISKIQITFKDKARADEKAREYVSILKRLATP